MKQNLIITLLSFIGLNAAAQTTQKNYNYQRGLEAIQNEQLDEAIKFFYKDIDDNPKNGYAYSWLAWLHLYYEEYGDALTAVESAIKYLPKKDVEYNAFAYNTRGQIYLNIEDTIKALADYSAAIRLTPDESSLYEKRAQIYYEQGRYDLSDADYRKMTAFAPGDVIGYMGLGRNANAQEKWDEALQHFNYVIKLKSDYASGYSFRAQSYIGLERWNEATDDIISALQIDWNRKALYLATHLDEPAFTMLVSKMKVQAAKARNESMWTYSIGLMYKQARQYEKAINSFAESNTIDASDVTFYQMATCYAHIGNFEQALNNINQAINMYGNDLDYLTYRANLYYEMGDVQRAIAEWDAVLQQEPEYAWGYYRRGWFKKLTGNDEGAIEDLSMAIVLEPAYSYAYATRGDIYQAQGKQALAEADFRKVIELEDTPDKYECIHYAYHGLGMDDKAIEAMNSIIAQDTTVAGSYYDAACLYARMQDKDNALQYLEKSLELGYARFAHIERDADLDYIRNTEEFKALIAKYKTNGYSAAMPEVTPTSSTTETSETSEIPFVKENGIYKVQCQINGLPLHFVFDTGASHVTLSMVEANFMMKNGQLTPNDVIGSQHYMDANGDISVGTMLNLKSVTFGTCELTNVRATVVRNQKAPLLLGQSVLGRLGKIEIDNQNRVLRITHEQ